MVGMGCLAFKRRFEAQMFYKVICGKVCSRIKVTSGFESGLGYLKPVYNARRETQRRWCRTQKWPCGYRQHADTDHECWRCRAALIESGSIWVTLTSVEEVTWIIDGKAWFRMHVKQLNTVPHHTSGSCTMLHSIALCSRCKWCRTISSAVIWPVRWISMNHRHY